MNTNSVLWRAARAVWRVPDRLLHPLRHRAALRRLRSRPLPRLLLVVCNGNICRSPYAAARLEQELTQRAQTAMRVECAGFAVWGRSCPPFALEVAASQGLDLSKHSSKPIMPVVAVADLIVVMDKRQARIVGQMFERAQRDILILGDLDPEPIAARGIVDPWGQPKDVFEHCYARINRCVHQLVGAVADRGQPSRSAGRAALRQLGLLM